MARVVGIDHLSIRVSDYEKSKAFYGRLFAFLGFEVEAEYPGTIGWKNGHTLFWIGQADSGGRQAPDRGAAPGIRRGALRGTLRPFGNPLPWPVLLHRRVH